MIREGIALPASSLALPGTTGLYRENTVALPAQTGDDPGFDIAGRATGDKGRATVNPARAPAKPGSFQKNNDNLR
jgi:hypothetical protein